VIEEATSNHQHNSNRYRDENLEVEGSAGDAARIRLGLRIHDEKAREDDTQVSRIDRVALPGLQEQRAGLLRPFGRAPAGWTLALLEMPHGYLDA